MRTRIQRMFQLGLVVFLSGCVNFEPKPDPTRHFTLGPSEPLAEMKDRNRKPIYIRRPDLPAYATGNRFMVREDGGELRAVGGIRWAEAMSEGLARSLGEWISGESGLRVSGYYPWPALEDDSLDVKVQFLQWVATDRGEIVVTADWRIFENGSVVAQERYHSQGIRWTPGEPETMVDGYNAALRQMAESITEDLR
ncbi:MAG: membrane integrity-associated transporter subunit PqiC [Opitutales bacterium]